MRNRRLSRRRQRGSGAVMILVIGLAIFAMAIGTTMLTSATTSITEEAKRYGQDRARMNSESGLTMGDFRLKRELPVLFQQIVEASNEAGLDGQQRLATLEFEPIEYTFAIPGSGSTEEDTATVRVEIGLPGPPVVTNTSGTASGPEVGTVETYTFVARLASTGRSLYGASWAAERTSHVYVTIVLGEIESEVLTDLGGGGSIDMGAVDGPLFETPERTGSWELVPSVYAAGTDAVTVGTATIGGRIWPLVWGPGGSSAGGWNKTPEIVTGPGLVFPKAVGQPNGDLIYYWWIRGLPAGTTAEELASSVEGAEVYVLAVDAWRFDPSYSLADDLISYQRPDGTMGRKFGSPRYGVVAVRAPNPYYGAKAGPAAILDARIDVPGRGTVVLTVDDQSWKPNTTDTAYAGIGYRVVGIPRDFPAGATAEARVVDPDSLPAGTPPLGLTASSESVLAESRSDITVPGEASSSSMVGTGGGGGSGTITLLSVTGRRANVGMSWGDGSSANATINSRHLLTPGSAITIGSGPPVIVDPPPPGGGGSRVQILAVMYVPLWTQYAAPGTGAAPVPITK